MSPLRPLVVFALGGVLAVGCGGSTDGGGNGGEGGTHASGGEGTHLGGMSGGSETTGGRGGTTGSGGSATGGTSAGSGGSGAEATGGSSETGGASSGGESTRSGGAGGSSSGGKGGAGGTSSGKGGSAGMVGTGGSSGGNASGGTSGQSGGGGSAGSAGERSVQCTGTMPYFPKFDRSCAKAEDCVAVAHQTNCCGARLVSGISASEQAAFAAAEAICDQQYPACGCAAFGTDVEDGTKVDFAWQGQVEVVCDAGSCKAQYSGTSFACGPSVRCTEQQYCTESSGGPAGTPMSYTCSPTACTDCSCISPQTDCTCSQVDGHLKLVCIHA